MTVVIFIVLDLGSLTSSSLITFSPESSSKISLTVSSTMASIVSVTVSSTVSSTVSIIVPIEMVDFVVKIDEAVVELIDISALMEVAILVDDLMGIDDSVVIVSIDFIVVVGTENVDFEVVDFVDKDVVAVKMADDAVPPNEGGLGEVERN